MANPLQMLKLKAGGFQFIQETKVNAAPKKVWKTLANLNSWFGFNPDRKLWSMQKMDLKPGGLWTSVGLTGNSSLFGVVTLIEPGKLLRITGPMGLSHIPTTNVVIFEVNPSKDGKTTVLKVGMRVSGLMDVGLEKRYKGAWKQLAGQLKEAAEV